MDRRAFLSASAVAPLLGALPGVGVAQTFAPQPGRWRTFELVTRVEVAKPAGITRAWVPVPVVDTDWQKPLSNNWTGNARTTEQITDAKYGASLIYAEWPESEKAPVLEVTSRFQTQDRASDLGRKTAAPGEGPESRAFWTQATDLMPTDGIVRKTSAEIVRGKNGDLEKVRALYDWVVTNSYREPKVRGCGVGDIRGMLETGNLGGKCGDLNGLFVGLARSAGIPARDIYGIRIAKSGFGYKALSANSPDVSKAQHCRSEVYLRDHGWVAMDPADVLKVMREETPEWIKTTSNALVVPVNARLFGGWEGNWVGYNTAHDVALPHSKGSKLGFFMYPQAETSDGRLDSLDPDSFKYRITAREVPSA
ncbi:MAG: transglutaminase domain-containing protein [Betaproteobacteria bacterium]